MKRLLLLTYKFPPAPSPGALRPGYIAQYLRDFGWDVTVVTHGATPPPFDVRMVPVSSYDDGLQQMVRRPADSRGLDAWHRRCIRHIKNVLAFPDEMAPWILPALSRSLRLARRERFDAILSTALPTSVHVVAGILARLTGLPWVADYRDAWSGNPYMEWGPIKGALEKATERALLRKAGSITTISEPIAEHLRTLHRGSNVSVVPNAYDPSEWSSIAGAAPKGFDLCYAGTMYDGKRSPDLLFSALHDLRREEHPAGSAARLHFYGKGSRRVPESAAKFEIGDRVHIHGPVPRAQVMQAQRESAALLIFLSMDPATKSETGSKFLEYVGAGRPILAFGPSGSALQQVIERQRLGWFACDSAGAKIALRSAYETYSSGWADFHPNTDAFPTARDLAQRFAGILNEAIANPRALVQLPESA